MKTKKQALVWAGIWFLAILLVLDTAFAARKTGLLTTVTTGNREIVAEDIPEARQAAVSDAMERAVVNAFASTVSPRVFAAHLDFLYDRILPAARDYVVTYRVLGEISHRNTYLVGVESKINLVQLEQVLTEAKILNVGTDMPTILLLIAEKGPKDLLPRYWWGNNPAPYISHAETRIMDILLDKRFHVAGMGPERPDTGFYEIHFPSIYDAGAAVDLAKKVHADLVVVGRASAAESANRMGEEKIFDADIRLTTYDVGSGQQVAACEKTAAAKSGPDQKGAVQAIEKVAGLGALELAEKLDRYWSGHLRKETHFDVAITGNGFLPRFLALKKRMGEIAEIENMQPKEMGSDRAVMELVYKGSPSHFADSIMLKTFEGFGVEIGEISDNLVKIRFIDKNRFFMTDDAPSGISENENPEKTME
ncbi:MAG TPA: hypothetical protein VJ943_11290 [Desulfotignum sp.]|nr:hypothetical protein [Desulfotignum sp.]